jgi:chromosomal replication initiator protein
VSASSFSSLLDQSITAGKSADVGAMMDDFILDQENRLLSVLEGADVHALSRFSPVLIVGPSAVGKSFTSLWLIDQLARKHHWNSDAALTVSGADFYRSYNTAVETNSLSDWRSRFFQAQVILIDGLQQLAQKTEAQAELRFICDQCEYDQRLLIATCLESADSLNQFDASLVSRLMAGLSIPLTLPGLEARREYLDAAARKFNMQWAPDALDLLAGKLSVSYGTLRSAILQMKQEAGRQKTVITVEAVNRFLSGCNQLKPDLTSIASLVAKHFLIKMTDLKGPSRKQSIVRARGVAIYLARNLSHSSLESVGAFFGNRDHTTILHAFRKTERLLDQDLELHGAVQSISQQLKQ